MDRMVRIEQLSYHPRTDVEEDSRCNPLKVPESAFDNDTSLLWRTLRVRGRPGRRLHSGDLELAAEGDYHADGAEQQRVETPAGELTRGSRRSRGRNSRMQAWFATTPEHRLLKYDNDDLVFLTRARSRTWRRPVTLKACPPTARDEFLLRMSSSSSRWRRSMRGAGSKL